MKAFLAVTAIGVLVVSAAEFKQPVQSVSVSNVFVHVIGASWPQPIPRARVDLVDSSGRIVRTVETGGDGSTAVRLGPGTSDKDGVLLTDVPFGEYEVRANDVRMYFEKSRHITVSRPEHWFTVSLVQWPIEGHEPRLIKTQFKLRRIPQSRPMWARLSGLFSESIDETKINEDGSFEFEPSLGTYILTVYAGTNVCRIQRIDIVTGKPVSIEVDRTCK